MSIRVRDVIFLPECPVCGNIISGSVVCDRCEFSMENARLEKSVFTLGTEIGDVQVAGSFSYEFEPIRTLLFYFKRRINSDAARYAAMKMLFDVRKLDIHGSVLFVNVPRSSKNRRKYGYDQSALIARRISGLYGGDSKFRSAIKRLPFSREQKALSGKDRKSNVRNRFFVSPFSRLFLKEPENVVIVDDVLTTGSSIAESARVLRNAFPNAKIFAAVFAVR